jgi:hypothetical protein
MALLYGGRLLFGAEPSVFGARRFDKRAECRIEANARSTAIATSGCGSSFSCRCPYRNQHAKTDAWVCDPSA